ncbi:MAG: GNAT family N-acetyltransferase [Lachnospiraceae bacterium]|nr:GNAT family N-acetyltransferase [Lachnospiraceae bacterium]
MEFHYQIRTIQPEDLQAAAQVERCCFPEAEAATEESLKFRIQTFPESFLVAEAEGKLIGFVNGCVTNDRVICDPMFEDASYHIPDGDYQAIFGLDVIPEYRCHGVAADLMNHLIADARNKGRKGLILTCKDRLIPYYEKFGYRNMGISESTHGGAVWYDMILEFEVQA